MEHGKAVSHQEDTNQPQSMYRQDSDCKVHELVCCCLQFSDASLESDSSRSLTAEVESKGVQSSGPQQLAASVAVPSAIAAPVPPLPVHVHHQHDEGTDGGDAGGVWRDRTASMDKGSADGSFGRAEGDGATRRPYQRKGCGEGDQQVQDSSRSPGLDGQKGPRVGEEPDHRRPQEDPVRSGNEAGDTGGQRLDGLRQVCPPDVRGGLCPAQLVPPVVCPDYGGGRRLPLAPQEVCYMGSERLHLGGPHHQLPDSESSSGQGSAQVSPGVTGDEQCPISDDTELRMGGDRGPREHVRGGPVSGGADREVGDAASGPQTQGGAEQGQSSTVNEGDELQSASEEECDVLSPTGKSCKMSFSKSRSLAEQYEGCMLGVVQKLVGTTRVRLVEVLFRR